MKFTTAILVALVLLLTFSVNAKPPHREQRSWYDKEHNQIKEVFYILSDKGRVILDSAYQSFYDNGNLKIIGEYKNGKQSGLWQYFYENGTMKAKGTYLNNVQDGHWEYYYESGDISSEGKLENGQKSGLWFYYFENGKKKSSGEFINGKSTGEWTYYYEDGLKKGIAVYDATGLGAYTEYYPDGKLKAEGYLRNGQSDSTWAYYYPNGKLKAKGPEKQGQKQGLWEYYYENGRLSAAGEEIRGQRNGQWNLFWEDGRQKAVGNFTNGSGKYQEFYDNGTVKVSGDIKRGKSEGEWIYYFDDGTVEGKADFVAGEGLYKGYYRSGQLKMEGLIKDGQKVGSWKLYKENGELAGYYKNYYELENPPANDSLLAETATAGTLSNKSTDIGHDKSGSSDKNKKTKRTRNYSIILSANPFAIFLKSLPIYLELYEDKHWGYELEAIGYRNPFFTSHNNLPNNEVVSYGGSLGLKQKRYQKKKSDIGRPYLAQEFRYTFMDYKAHVLAMNNIDRQTLEMTGNNFEYTILIGDRLLKSYRKSGLAFDVFAGIGVGYRFYNKNWSNNIDYDIIFGSISQASWYVPLRFGFSLGYRF